ncbi:NAD(P)-dependent dehydrogenase (short-subunit alcohol dehydrogenase family) [Collimonas sp. PA-H2]|nr:SDR family oxidoreductase [Collimonas sp. PA-H2]PFH10725.1 NAD(P)-dependent dehydrogenase (short-subunit alcohol dehydrogenase family) [Collimonas sp. PA-H2]
MIFDSQAFAGKKYLVTGASSGIGKATAIGLAACGASIIAMGRDEVRTRETIALLAPSADHQVMIADFADADAVATVVKDTALQAGGIDGVFHGAGLELNLAIKMTKRANIDKIFAASVFSAFGIARALSFRGVIRDEGGSFVLMSSAAGLRGQTGMTAYSSSKAAIDGMVRSLAVEFAPRRIRVNSIASGGVTTEMHERMSKALPDSAMENYESKHLLGFGSPDDIVSAAMFLLSSGSTWITGSTMVVDGGYSVR